MSTILETSAAVLGAEISARVATVEFMEKHNLLDVDLRKARDIFEKVYIETQLARCRGRVGRLAKVIGMERTHLYRKLKSLGIDHNDYLSDDDLVPATQALSIHDLNQQQRIAELNEVSTDSEPCYCGNERTGCLPPIDGESHGQA